MFCYGRFIIFAVLISLFTLAADGNQPAARIRIESGGIIPFQINSMRKYNEGQILANWTILSFHIENQPEAVQWRVEVSTSNEVLIGDYGSTLPTEALLVKAHETIPSDPGLTFPLLGGLNNTPQTLVEGSGNGTFHITISYSIGTQEEYILLGQQPDYYFSELYFDLIIN